MFGLIFGGLKALSPSTWLIIGMAFLVLVSGIYFKYSQNVIKGLQEQVVVLTVSLETQKKHVASLEKDITLMKKINKELTDQERTAAKKESELAKKLQKLKKVAKAKPKLVEDIINDASKERTRCIELATGAKPIKDEKNSVCPQLLLKR